MKILVTVLFFLKAGGFATRSAFRATKEERPSVFQSPRNLVFWTVSQLLSVKKFWGSLKGDIKVLQDFINLIVLVFKIPII